MSCDLGPAIRWLWAALGAAVGSAGAVAVAAVLNGSFWKAYLSPVPMLLAAGLAALAGIFLNRALEELNNWWSCVQSSCPGAVRGCSGGLENIRTNIRSLQVVLGIQASSAAGAAAYAWIPGAAQPAMWAILGALVVQIALIVSLIAFLASLASCVRENCTSTRADPITARAGTGGTISGGPGGGTSPSIS